MKFKKVTKLYNIRIDTGDNANFRQRIAEVNDLRENVPLVRV